MSEFSEQLTLYIKRCSVNISKLSYDTGIDRTILHKYISGRRIPGDTHIVYAICKGLLISDEDTRMLLDRYNLSYYGPQIYAQKKKSAMIIDTLNNAGQSRLCNSIKSVQILPASGCSVLSGQHAVRAAIQNILMSTDSCVYILAAGCNSIADDIAMVCAHGYSPQVTHIMPLSAGTVPDHTSYNISCLLDILPAVIYSDKYSCCYFYCNPEAVSKNAGLLSDIIITDKCVLRFESDLSCGVFETSSEIINLYLSLAVGRHESSEILIKKELVPHLKKCGTGSYIKENVCISNEDKKNVLYYSINDTTFRLLINEPDLNGLFSPENITFFS